MHEREKLIHLLEVKTYKHMIVNLTGKRQKKYNFVVGGGVSYQDELRTSMTVSRKSPL